MIRPFESSEPNRYSRLFPPTDPPFAEEDLVALGVSTATRGGVPFRRLRQPVSAGLTYFGQFIDHDLTHDRTPLAEAGKLPPPQTINFRNARLDLGLLYGGGPAFSGELYKEDGCRFRLGSPIDPLSGQLFDVALDARGFPLMGDSGTSGHPPKNAENPMIRQLHVLFQHLHNQAVDETPDDWPAPQRYQQAHQRVQWEYQKLVREYFLRMLCDPAIYREVILENRKQIDWNDNFSIPIEFSMAAFRFGHSMVRPDYEFRPNQDINLMTLLQEARMPGPLSEDRSVDWSTFFNDRQDDGPAEPSMMIGCRVVPALHQLPCTPAQLPVITLLRGARTGLATGQEVATALGHSPLILDGKGWDPEEAPWDLLQESGLSHRTPLWYYVLLEAQLLADGQHLGPVGSRLIAEVIDGALQADPQSFLNQNPTWNSWPTSEAKSILIRRLRDLARVTGFIRD